MSYRILEMTEPTPEHFENAKEIARYDSAYRAMNAMKRAARRRGSPPSWYLVDGQLHILARPDDLIDDDDDVLEHVV